VRADITIRSGGSIHRGSAARSAPCYQISGISLCNDHRLAILPESGRRRGNVWPASALSDHQGGPAAAGLSWNWSISARPSSVLGATPETYSRPLDTTGLP
jgi:hypothetical protein